MATAKEDAPFPLQHGIFYAPQQVHAAFEMAALALNCKSDRIAELEGRIVALESVACRNSTSEAAVQAKEASCSAGRLSQSAAALEASLAAAQDRIALLEAENAQLSSVLAALQAWQANIAAETEEALQEEDEDEAAAEERFNAHLQVRPRPPPSFQTLALSPWQRGTLNPEHSAIFPVSFGCEQFGCCYGLHLAPLYFSTGRHGWSLRPSCAAHGHRPSRLEAPAPPPRPVPPRPSPAWRCRRPSMLPRQRPPSWHAGRHPSPLRLAAPRVATRHPTPPPAPSPPSPALQAATPATPRRRLRAPPPPAPQAAPAPLRKRPAARPAWLAVAAAASRLWGGRLRQQPPPLTAPRALRLRELRVPAPTAAVTWPRSSARGCWRS